MPVSEGVRPSVSEAERLASASSPASVPTSAAMPSKISLVLSKKARPFRSPARRRSGNAGAGDAGSGGVTCSCGAVDRGRVSATLLLGGEQILELAHELPDVTKVPVNRGKAHVGYLVEPLQL